MPTVNLNKKVVLQYLGRKIKDEQLADYVSYYGTDLGKITSDEIIVEIFPNRPDMLSEEGFARALKGFLNLEKGLKKYEVNRSNYAAKLESSTKRVREFVGCAVVKDVKITNEFLARLMQAQEKLHSTHSRNRKNAAIGVHDLDAIAFPLTYTTVRENFRFIPLESTRGMSIKEILEKHPKGREYKHLLTKNLYPVWIDANKKVASFPPIINGVHTALSTKTRNLFIDVTGLDKKVVDQALHMLVTMLADAGGKIYYVKVNGKEKPDLKPREIDLEAEYVNKLLGLRLDANEIKKHLEKMRYGIKSFNKKELKVLVPCYRTDVLHPIDLVEDVAIAYGYERFEAFIPNVSTIGEEEAGVTFARKMAEVMVGIGLVECSSYHLTNKTILFDKMNLPQQKVVETENAINLGYDVLRNALLPGLMKILSENTHYEYPQALFEIGKVIKAEKQTREELHLAIVKANGTAEFSEIRGMIQTFSKVIGKEVGFKETKHPPFIEGRAVELIFKGKSVGVLGEIHPQVLENWALEVPVVACEINLELLK